MTDNPWLPNDVDGEDALLAEHYRREQARLTIESNLDPSAQVKLIERERPRHLLPEVPDTHVTGLVSP